MINLKDRQLIELIILIVKIIKKKINTNHFNMVSNMINVNSRTRSNNMMRISNSFSWNSPIFNGSVTLNRYRQLFSLDDSIEVIKTKLKNHFITNRNKNLV